MDELISEREFHEVWRPSVRPSGDLLQFDDVCDKPLRHVWTIVDGGEGADGNWYACTGFHVVNHLGYVITEKAWEDDTWDAIYFLDDFDHTDD